MTELIDNPPPLPECDMAVTTNKLCRIHSVQNIRQIEAAAFARGVAAGRNAGLDDVHAAIEAADDGEQSAYRHCQEIAWSLKQ